MFSRCSVRKFGLGWVVQFYLYLSLTATCSSIAYLNLSYEVFTEWPGRERKVTSRALSELGHSDSKPPGMSVDGAEILLAAQSTEY